MERIVIHTDLDLTPAGKRRFKVGNYGNYNSITWYVSGRRYHSIPNTAENLKRSQEWAKG